MGPRDPDLGNAPLRAGGDHGDAMLCVFFLNQKGDRHPKMLKKSDGEMMEIGISMGMYTGLYI